MEQLEKVSSAESPLVNYSWWEQSTSRAFSWMTRASHIRAVSGADRNQSLTSSLFLFIKAIFGNIMHQWIVTPLKAASVLSKLVAKWVRCKKLAWEAFWGSNYVGGSFLAPLGGPGVTCATLELAATTGTPPLPAPGQRSCCRDTQKQPQLVYLLFLPSAVVIIALSSNGPSKQKAG